MQSSNGHEDQEHDASVAAQRHRQAAWRPWAAMLDVIQGLLPPTQGAPVALDFGSGAGDVLQLMLQRGWCPIGIDSDPAMLAAAAKVCPGARLVEADLLKVTAETLGVANVELIWTSYTVQYFTTALSATLASWAALLRPGGLLAIVEIDGLLSCHEPQADGGVEAFLAVEKALLERHGYHCHAARRVETAMHDAGFQVEHASDFEDAEFAFDGAALPQILRAWNERFARMQILRPGAFFEAEELEARKQAFLECLASPAHRTTSRVRLVIGRRP